MNNLTNIKERIDIMQAELNTLKSLAEQSVATPKYELSDLMKETIVQLLDRFIDDNVFDNLDRDYTVYANGSGCNVEVNLDLNDVVCDQLDSSHRMANNFLDELIRELDNLREQEEDEATESGEQQHQDC
jgi:hypothetical protein